MVFANVRDLKNKTSAILRLVQKEDVVVTSHGKPKAVLHRLSEEDLEDYLLENSPVLHRALEEAHRESLRLGTVSLKSYARKRKIRI